MLCAIAVSMIPGSTIATHLERLDLLRQALAQRFQRVGLAANNT